MSNDVSVKHVGHYLPIHDGNLHKHIQSRSDIETKRLHDLWYFMLFEASKGSERNTVVHYDIRCVFDFPHFFFALSFWHRTFGTYYDHTCNRESIK